MTAPFPPSPGSSPAAAPAAFDPFRAKTVEPIALTTPEQRRRFLAEAEHNLFRLRSDQVMIDLITDSGTGAMSSNQWAAMMRGDESYAGSLSFHRLNDLIRRYFGLPYMLPTHQGRIAERLLVEAIIGKMPAGNGMIVPNNAHFDTTRSMIEASGAEAVNLLRERSQKPETRNQQCRNHLASDLGPPTSEFLGDIDTRKLHHLLHTRTENVPFVLMTVTCNSNGGQPVSMENLREVREICDDFGKLLIFDACRFAENAWFNSGAVGSQPSALSQKPKADSRQPIATIVREMFDLADGAVMSTRKDALCNVGGLLLLRDEAIYRKACNLCVLTEGFQMTYGTLPARDLEAIAVGLQEAMDETYLTTRVEMVQSLALDLHHAGVPVVMPAGGHAVYLDAEAFCPHLSRSQSPAHSLACAIYEHAGIRCTRIGTVLKNDCGEPMEVVRLAIPRRTYSHSHLSYVASAISDLHAHSHTIVGVTSAPPAMIRCEEPAFQAA